MISKDEQDIGMITEEELLEIDAVDEHELYKAELEKAEAGKASVEKPSPVPQTILNKQVQKKGVEQPQAQQTPLPPKEVDLLAEDPVKKAEKIATAKANAPMPENNPTEPVKPNSANNHSNDGSDDNSGENLRPTAKKRKFLAPLLGIVVLGGLGGIWYQTNSQLNSIEKSLADSNHKALLGVKKQDDVIDLMQKKVADVGAQQQELQSTLSRLTDHKEDNWLLAEALYLSRLAVERLQTTQDIKTAIVQLSAADEKLRQVADPSLMPVRKILVDKIAELKAVNAPDFEGLWLQLGVISDMAEKLVPLRADKNKTKQQDKTYPVGWRGALSQSWDEIKNLVKVRSPEENASAPMYAGKLLSELDEEGLKRGFRLFIEQSRWALVQREAWLYTGSIDNAQKWLAAYFSQDPTARLINVQLEQLKANHINIAVPDVSAAVTAIHNLIQQRQKMLAG